MTKFLIFINGEPSLKLFSKAEAIVYLKRYKMSFMEFNVLIDTSIVKNNTHIHVFRLSDSFLDYFNAVLEITPPVKLDQFVYQHIKQSFSMLLGIDICSDVLQEKIKNLLSVNHSYSALKRVGSSV